jgi:hypothetical protein
MRGWGIEQGKWIAILVAGCMASSFVWASQVTNPCIGRTTTETVAPRMAAWLSGWVLGGEVVFEGGFDGLDGRIRQMDGCGNQTEEPVPLGSVSTVCWIEAPDGFRWNGLRCPVMRSGVYTGNYRVNSASGVHSIAQFTVEVPEPRWEWLEPPQVQIVPSSPPQKVELLPFHADYPLEAEILPGVRFDRNGCFPNQSYPFLGQARLTHRWKLFQFSNPGSGEDLRLLAEGQGLHPTALVQQAGRLQMHVETELQTTQPVWNQRVENVIEGARVMPVEIHIRKTPALEDDIVVVTRELGSSIGWDPDEAFEIFIDLPEDLQRERISIQPLMDPESVGQIFWEKAFYEYLSGQKLIVRGWGSKPGLPGRPDRIGLRILHPSFTTTVFKDIQILPMSFKGREISMLSGHPGDAIELCPISGVRCTWRFLDPTSPVGVFQNPEDSHCVFVAKNPGVNVIQMWMGPHLLWKRVVNVLPIVSREQWGAVKPKPHQETMPGFQHLTLHHSSNTSSGPGEMRRIQRLHMSLFPYNFFAGKNFYDIGYHYVLDKEGMLYEGRRLESEPGIPGGPFTKGEHVGSNNTVAGLGVCLMGDYEKTEGNESIYIPMMIQLEKYLAALCVRYRIRTADFSYHRALSVGTPSLCPGSNFIPVIPPLLIHVSNYLP